MSSGFCETTSIGPAVEVSLPAMQANGAPANWLAAVRRLQGLSRGTAAR